MSLKVQIKNDVPSVDKLHYLPCHIEKDGPANVDQYFSSYMRSEGQPPIYNTSLRGRGLEGKTCSLPEKVRGIIVQEQSVMTEDQARIGAHVGSFTQFTRWEWDKKLSDEDPLNKALHWFKLSQIIHNTDDD